MPVSLAGSVAAIGNFDGVHRGHRALIERVVETGRPATIVTFEPHPRAFFRPDDPVFRLTPEPVKLAIFARLGLDGAFVLRLQRRAGGPGRGFVRRSARLQS